MIIAAINPVPVRHPVVHIVKGRPLVSQRYIVGWLNFHPDWVLVKVGRTTKGLSRCAGMLLRGGRLLELAHYSTLEESAVAESWLHGQMAERYTRAFRSEDRADAREFLGSVAGFTECYWVPRENLLDVLELAQLGWWEGADE